MATKKKAVVYKPLIPFSQSTQSFISKEVSSFNPVSSLQIKNPSFISQNSIAAGNYTLYTVPAGKITKIIGLSLSIAGSVGSVGLTQADILLASNRILEVGSGNEDASPVQTIILPYENAIVIRPSQTVIKRIFGAASSQCCATLIYIEEDLII